ncbi:cation:proton antiporter [Pedobacter sp. P351]|uniref:cation:proton antiporter n=1 Tax=Pedobacter superstes TaxID=3133441 RepID=UPI0030A710DC
MVHLPQLIYDLGLILAAAGVTTLIFKRIKQPLVLGYILAGFLVGPHFSLVPTIADAQSITVWAEIGVIFLLFSLGLEFSFKKLVKVGGSASITAIVEVIFMLFAGYAAGRIIGWSHIDSIFLGGILSISSTTIIIRAFEELGVKHKQFAGLVFGVLIVEDLVAILLLVLLSTVAVSQQFAGTEMLTEVFKLLFFLTLWFLGGIFLIPTFLKRTRKLMNDETLMIVSLALCLLMVIFATKVGFSPALGAFVMGSILAETPQAERIEHLTKSVKDLFAAVFFISVGMLINPYTLGEHFYSILIITAVTVLGKFLSSGLGALLSGQTLKTSVQTGLSLAQIGEFSFIIATLGLTLKVTSEFLYPIAVAVSAITTFSTPYLIRFSEPFYNYIEKKMPERWVRGIGQYSSSTEKITSSNDWKMLLKAYAMNLTIHSVILIAIIFISTKFIHPQIVKYSGSELNADLVSLLFSILLMTPFLWALAGRRIEKHAYTHLWLKRRIHRGPLIAIEIFRIILAVCFIGFAIYLIMHTWYAVLIAVVLLGLLIVIFSNRLQVFYEKLEKRFLVNLNSRDLSNQYSDIVPWDAHLTELEVSPESSLAGKTLNELAFRERYGVNVALIERGRLAIPTPVRDERLFPNDKLTVIGSDEQIAQIKKHLEVSSQVNEDVQFSKKDLQLQKVKVLHQSQVCYKSIRDSGIKEITSGLIIGIERNDQRILNPESTLVFQPDDIVYIVGNKKRIKDFFTQNV